MNVERASRLVDQWAADLRLYLDGKLHRVARQALIDRLVAATALDDDDASEDLEGRVTTDADVKAIALKVHADDVSRREAARGEPPPGEPSSDIERLASRLGGGSEEAQRLLDTTADEAQKAADALAVMQDVATATGRPLLLTPKQIDRFNEFGLLDGVRYQTTEPATVEVGDVVQDKRKPGRPAKR